MIHVCLIKKQTRSALSRPSHARADGDDPGVLMPPQTTTSHRAAPVTGSDHRRRWWILAVLGIAPSMVVLDAPVVNIALLSTDGAAFLHRQSPVDRHRIRAGDREPVAGRRADRRSVLRRDALITALLVRGQLRDPARARQPNAQPLGTV